MKTILYDRTCNFCCAAVKFYKEKSGSQLDSLEIQSEEARIVLRNYGERFIKLNTIYLVAEGKIYKRSEATFQIIRSLKYPYKLLYFFAWLPKSVADAAYDFVAKRRHLIAKTKNQVSPCEG